MEKTLKDIRFEITGALDNAGFENPIDEARWLLAYVLGKEASYITLNLEEIFPQDLALKLEETLRRRLAHEPLSRIRGCREFWSLEFDLNHETLDPRPDSEILVETVLGLLQHKSNPYKILDLGTGTGCLLISLLKELPNAFGVGMDCSLSAINMARHNAKKLGTEGRASFFQGSWSAALSGYFDIIISNPPYIPYRDKETLSEEVSKYDPCRALYGGEDGYDCYRALAQDLFRIVSKQGFIALELGMGQRYEVQCIFQGLGYHVLDVKKDLQGIERVILFSVA
ncbi:Peptide chain release factor N(5)-glutamine methyltransferase [Candidatus Bealeia paramacronuclearis]|uniref:Release factor glutamine methyltransferase n=1 Tax=Candidatus Bealeia paramacronuclearis TaxID=1921001 RepID=A0ABZ2C4U3_9PROT|nr:Peptide chain release factor N(5)-glutamine methyltransferase [Candidatus Bealeia paramacronuclearis]